jgi:hypothetical protein
LWWPAIFPTPVFGKIIAHKFYHQPQHKGIIDKADYRYYVSPTTIAAMLPQGISV